MKRISKRTLILCIAAAAVIIIGAGIAASHRGAVKDNETTTQGSSVISTLLQTVTEAITTSTTAPQITAAVTTTVPSTTKPVTTKAAVTAAPVSATVTVPSTTAPSTTQAETTTGKSFGDRVKDFFRPETTATTVPTTLPPLPTSAKVEGVPYLNQISLGFPMGCEAVSATMLLNFYGYEVTAEQMVNATPTGSKKYQKDGVWYAADPFEEFVGDPRKKRADGAYGCFAKPLAEGMMQFAGDRVKNISGCTVEDLFRHVSEGRPVVVWGASKDVKIYEGVEWQCVDSEGNLTGKTYQELVREHCLVLIGYNETSAILHDPSKGANIAQPLEQFTSNWITLFSQAIIIE